MPRPALRAAARWLARTALIPALGTALAVATAAAPGTAQASTVQASTTPASTGSYALFTEPGQGFSPVYNRINGAKKSIDLTMYELEDTTAEHDLAAAASRGVTVKVILDQRESSDNQSAYNYLTSHGVKVVWSWSRYYFTHEKSMVVDGTTAVIMTANLTSQYYSTSRDFGVVDTNAADVAAIQKVFNADFAHTAITPPAGADLVWSPTSAQSKILGLINGAQHSLRIYSEEMDDTAVENALISAAKRGVAVRLVGENENGEYDSAYSQLASAGVKIRYYSNPSGFYIHGKVIEADYNTGTAKIFIGSENFSSTSLTENRELGLIIGPQDGIMSSMEKTFVSDYNNGTPFS
jgi:phosphatidylserine/phosphatidylglycerophosphate/cardiolipin synthase-like enzyme